MHTQYDELRRLGSLLKPVWLMNSPLQNKTIDDGYVRASAAFMAFLINPGTANVDSTA
jgi:hypothetical protein